MIIDNGDLWVLYQAAMEWVIAHRDDPNEPQVRAVLMRIRDEFRKQQERRKPPGEDAPQP